MTNEEAFREVLNRVYRNTDDFEMRISKECYKLIIEALEKQIPKKPIFESEQTSPFGVDDVPYCPSCRCDLPEVSYCEKCGQALDWSDTE